MIKNYYNSPIGYLLLIGDDQYLYEVKFINNFKRIKVFNHPKSKILELAKYELDLYFSGKLKQFTTPLFINGTIFEQEVYQATLKIPYGEVQSYKNIAQEINHPKSFRAVSNALSKNKLPIFIPCHRVIRSNNKLGGYTGGIEIKKSLLELEEKYLKNQ